MVSAWPYPELAACRGTVAGWCFTASSTANSLHARLCDVGHGKTLCQFQLQFGRDNFERPWSPYAQGAAQYVTGGQLGLGPGILAHRRNWDKVPTGGRMGRLRHAGRLLTGRLSAGQHRRASSTGSGGRRRGGDLVIVRESLQIGS